MHRSRDTMHAQEPKTQCQWYPMKNVMIVNSRTNRRRVFKLGGRVGHVTGHVGQQLKVKRSSVKVTRSRNVSPDRTL